MDIKTSNELMMYRQTTNFSNVKILHLISTNHGGIHRLRDDAAVSVSLFNNCTNNVKITQQTSYPFPVYLHLRDLLVLRQQALAD